MKKTLVGEEGMSPRDWHFVPINRCANIKNVGLTNKRPGHRLGFAVQAVTVPFPHWSLAL